jgi:pyruvate dehydrogenase E2 component (dihydrolipoamide acetyltransferase)
MANEVKRTAYKGVRKIIGDTLTKSYSEDPHATIMTTADMTNYFELKKKWKAEGKSYSGTAFFIKAAGVALKDFPQFNTRLVPNEDGTGLDIVQYDTADAGVAVDTPKGLMMITIPDCGNRSIEDLTADIRDKADRIRNNKIKPEETRGSTFSISNEMMSTNTYFNSIINNNEAFIIGVPRFDKVPVYDENENIVPRMRGNLMLTYNHKMADGMPAAALLGKMAELLNDPEQLL